MSFTVSDTAAHQCLHLPRTRRAHVATDLQGAVTLEPQHHGVPRARFQIEIGLFEHDVMPARCKLEAAAGRHAHRVDMRHNRQFATGFVRVQHDTPETTRLRAHQHGVSRSGIVQLEVPGRRQAIGQGPDPALADRDALGRRH